MKIVIFCRESYSFPMIASVTELNLKNYWCFVRFLPHAIKSKMQADRAPGVVFTAVSSDGILVQRTLTVWKNADSLKNYVKSDAHLAAMKVFPKIAKKSFTARFEVTKPPTWEEALKHLRQYGKEHS